MLDINEFKQGIMYQALLELDAEMGKRNLPKCELNIVGGFALMTHKIRKETDVTDIDFVGENLPSELKELSDQIGLNNNLGKDWINNDLMLADTSFEDLEFSTGKLHFIPTFEFENLKINILDKKDLLRMKIISIDTATTAVELGGDFSRMKDFPDILALMQDMNVSYEDIKTDPQLFGGQDIMSPALIGDKTISYIQIYETKGERGVKSELLQDAKRNLNDAVDYLDNIKTESKEQPNSSFLDGILSDAIKRYEAEKQNVDSRISRESAIDRLYKEQSKIMDRSDVTTDKTYEN